MPYFRALTIYIYIYIMYYVNLSKIKLYIRLEERDV